MCLGYNIVLYFVNREEEQIFIPVSGPRPNMTGYSINNHPDLDDLWTGLSIHIWSLTLAYIPYITDTAYIPSIWEESYIRNKNILRLRPFVTHKKSCSLSECRKKR